MPRKAKAQPAPESVVWQGPEALRPLLVPVSSLKDDPTNVNVHDDLSYEDITASYARFNQQKAIVVDAGGVVKAGNGQLEAVRRLGWTHIAAVVSDLPEQELDLFALTDNQVAKRATYDYRALKDKLTAAIDAGVPVDDLGWQPHELAPILEMEWVPPAPEETGGAAVPEPRGSEAEALRAKWGVELGQTWVVPSRTAPGRSHRLVCGDCRDDSVVATACAGTVRGAFTSPPYAMQRKDAYGGVPADEYVAWFDAVQANVRDVLARDGSFFVNIKAHTEGGARHLYVLDLVLAMCRDHDWLLIDEFCWERQGPPGSWPNRFKNCFENIWHFARDKDIKFDPWNVASESEYAMDASTPKREMKTGSGFNTRESVPGLALPGNVIRTHNSQQENHPAAFPPELPEFFLKAFSDPGDEWLDPFVGSGTVLCAAERTGRVGMGVDSDPNALAVAIQRLSDLGLSPELEGGGQG